MPPQALLRKLPSRPQNVAKPDDGSAAVPVYLLTSNVGYHVDGDEVVIDNAAIKLTPTICGGSDVWQLRAAVQ